MGLVSVTALRASPFLGICPFGLWDSFETVSRWPTSTTMPASPCTCPIAMDLSGHRDSQLNLVAVTKASPLALLRYCWAVPLSVRPPCCPHLFHPAHLAVTLGPQLPFPFGAASSFAVPWQPGVRARLHLAMESRDASANFLGVFVML